MENYTVSISPEYQYQFQVEQHPHAPTGGCKYKIYREGKFVASLEPDGQDFLHVCQNPAEEEAKMQSRQIEIK